MIHYFSVRPHDYTIRAFFEHYGRAARRLIRCRFYDRLYGDPESEPPGAYIFADLERLDGAARAAASDYRRRLAAMGPRWRVLNDPDRSMLRFELLRSLHDDGTNGFAVQRASDDLGAVRLPAFLRGENDHSGASTGLLHTHDELEAAVRADGDALVVEFTETASDDGVYRKYSAFRVGDRIVARHVFFSRDWMVKDPDLSDPDLLEEEWEFVRANPHERELRPIFERARIEYGRIDYSLCEGRPVIWEINTNPMIASLVSRGIPARDRVHRHMATEIVSAFRALGRRR